MNCTIHRAEVACGTCAYCGKIFCGDCLVDVGGRFFCRDHIQHALTEAAATSRAENPPTLQQPPMVFMNAAGGAVAQQKKGVNHLLHFILTMLTGVWLFVWIFVCIRRS